MWPIYNQPFQENPGEGESELIHRIQDPQLFSLISKLKVISFN